MSNDAKKLKLSTTELMKNKEEDEDRISNLPKSVLHHIFSFLDMKEITQTSILSTTWRYLWTSHPVLNFSCNLFYSKKARTAESFKDFENFVDEALILRDGSNIQSFRLFCDHECDYYSSKCRLNTWIISAIRRNIQALYLHVPFTQEFQLPDCLFTCNSLVTLELKSTSQSTQTDLQINIPDSVSLPRLKTLLLESVEIDVVDIHKIMSSCQVLESFTVSFCRFKQKYLDICSITLKHLVIETCEIGDDDGCDIEDCRVKLWAPNLIFLGCKNFMWVDYSLENFSSLVKAEINQELEAIEISVEGKNLFAERMIKFLRALQNVEVLTLSALLVEVVTRYPASLETANIQFCNLRCLKLETWLSTNCVESMTYLLKISPNIESLFVEINEDKYSLHQIFSYWDEVWFNSAKLEDYRDAGVSLQCMLNHLKFVEVRGVRGYVNELMFLENVLKNAMVLEKMVVFTFKEESPHTTKRFIKFGEKLLTLPRASSSVGILVL